MPSSSILTLAARFTRDRSGTVAILGALAMTVLVGFVSLVTEYGMALEKRSANQRISDAAAYAAALHYSASGSNTALQNATIAANNLAALNGVAQADVAVNPTTTADGKSAVAVTITGN
ncbi:Flp pilus assembly protein TadG, partial [Rhodoblastus sphagnicola]